MTFPAIDAVFWNSKAVLRIVSSLRISSIGIAKMLQELYLSQTEDQKGEKALMVKLGGYLSFQAKQYWI